MKIAIIGGKLQGTEAVYLAKKAGFEIILIDRDAQVPPASGGSKAVKRQRLFWQSAGILKNGSSRNTWKVRPIL